MKCCLIPRFFPLSYQEGQGKVGMSMELFHSLELTMHWHIITSQIHSSRFRKAHIIWSSVGEGILHPSMSQFYMTTRQVEIQAGVEGSSRLELGHTKASQIVIGLAPVLLVPRRQIPQP